MSKKWKKFGAACVASLLVGSLGIANPVDAATAKAGPKRTVTVSVKGGSGLTLLLVSGTGRTLASKKITNTKKISLKTPKVSTTKGMNLQLVGADGEYFGPVVLGWRGSKSTSASRVYTRLKSTRSANISLGTISVTKVGASKKQGYATATKQVGLADKTSAATVKASRGRPLGVGAHGKSATATPQSVIAASMSVSATQMPSVNQPPPQPGAPQPGGQPGAGQQNAQAPTADDTLGGDKDDDGLPNAFDVDDDGDGILDAADASTPTPVVSADNGTRDCGSISWRIFTNFKATADNFANTINVYGSGSREASGSVIASRIAETMSMVFAPITQVCGSNVTKTEIKGNGVSYAPSTFVEVGATCNTGDYQWLIGKGRMCDTGGAGYTFSSPYTFTATDLPSGQDTFTMRVTTADNATYEFTSSPGFVFVTHPMLVSYNTGAGEQTIDYSAPTIPRIPVGSSTELTLKIYRPQRLAFDGETPGFYDLGGYRYSPDIPNNVTPGSSGPGKCDSLMVTDTALTADTLVSSSKPMLELKWNLGRCFSDKGVTWSAGSLTVDIQVEPSGPGGNSAQKLFLTTS